MKAPFPSAACVQLRRFLRLADHHRSGREWSAIALFGETKEFQRGVAISEQRQLPADFSSSGAKRFSNFTPRR